MSDLKVVRRGRGEGLVDDGVWNGFLAGVREGRVGVGEWLDVMKGLGRAGKVLGWRIGDGLNAGECAFGEKYSAAMVVFDLEKGTLANMAWVCRVFECSRRRYELSFAHHHEIAIHIKDEREQDRFLELAVKNGWSRSQLRVAMRRANATEVEEGSGRVVFVPGDWELEGISWYEEQLASNPPPERREALAKQVAATIARLQRIYVRLAPPGKESIAPNFRGR